MNNQQAVRSSIQAAIQEAVAKSLVEGKRLDQPSASQVRAMLLGDPTKGIGLRGDRQSFTPNDQGAKP